jgi:ribonuclease I
MTQNTTENIYKNETIANCDIRQYVLALQELCIDNQYTLHGLWADPSASCTSCTKEQFSENNLSEATLKDMNMYWMSCMNGSNNDHFWQHEWSRHGTCSGMSQEEFFSTAISLYKEHIDLCPKGSKTCQICLTPTLQLEGLCPVIQMSPPTNDNE